MCKRKYQISAPTTRSNEAHYRIECEFVMELELFRLVEDAVAVGWDELQVALAITSLCDRYIYGPEVLPPTQ
ncbi:hypothetical protein D7027_20995 [Ochrobactrum intermedium]|nr:hypothetical protein [Brucella intermedia]